MPLFFFFYFSCWNGAKKRSTSWTECRISSPTISSTCTTRMPSVWLVNTPFYQSRIFFFFSVEKKLESCTHLLCMRFFFSFFSFFCLLCTCLLLLLLPLLLSSKTWGERNERMASTTERSTWRSGFILRDGGWPWEIRNAMKRQRRRRTLSLLRLMYSRLLSYPQGASVCRVRPQEKHKQRLRPRRRRRRRRRMRLDHSPRKKK